MYSASLLKIGGVDRDDGERFYWVEEIIRTKLSIWSRSRVWPVGGAFQRKEVCDYWPKGGGGCLSICPLIFFSFVSYPSIHLFMDVSVSSCMCIYIRVGRKEGEVL